MRSQPRKNECSDDRKNLFSESKMQILRVCKSRGQFRAWVPGEQLDKIVDEAAKLRSCGFAWQSTIRLGSEQSGAVDLFDEDVFSTDLAVLGSSGGAGQILTATPT